MNKILFYLSLFFGTMTNAQDTNDYKKDVEDLLKKMTLDEKIGQMNQYNGFYDATGPSPKSGDASVKYKHLKSGLVGSMLNVRGVAQVKAIQKIAVEQTRLGIPLIFGFDLIHGYKTINPIPLAESASWDLAAIKKSAADGAKKLLLQVLIGPSHLWLMLLEMPDGEGLWRVLEKILITEA